MIAVVHAYSRANAGDSLLVDLTMARLAAIGVGREDITLVALDAESFSDLPHVVNLGTPGRAVDRQLLRALAMDAAAMAGRGAAGRVIAAADAFVAVGGGYLRAGQQLNAMGTLVNHLPALFAVTRSESPAIYLPQSVGPCRGPVGATVRRLLACITEVHVRDDRSFSELNGLPQVKRTPDLAVLDIADSDGEILPRALSERPVLVARSLPAPRRYLEGLRELEAHLGDVSWAVQSEGPDTKSDRKFYTNLNINASGLVQEVLDAAPGTVVSVRLHGALQAIMTGVPAVHLSYERKGWGAYEDLGLAAFVHNARDFDPVLVANQVRELQRDPVPFWDAVRSRVPRLREQSASLNDSLSRICGSGGSRGGRMVGPWRVT